MAKTVWTYWEGEKPQYINQCLASFKKVCGSDLRLVTPETVTEYLPPDVLHPNWKKIPHVACKACCLRAALTYTHGGWWFDADTVVLEHPGEVQSQFVYTTWTSTHRVLNGYFGAQSGGATVGAWLNMINYVLRYRFDEIESWWLILGEYLLSTCVILHGGQRVKLSQWLPIDINKNPKPLVDTGNYEEFIRPHTVAFGLNNSWLVHNHYKIINASAKRMKNSPILLHQLLSKEC